MAAYTGVGTRIRERMVKLGYVRADGEPDVQRFSWDFRYDRTLIYAWLANKATPFKDLIRLARDLQISVEWLLTGQERHGHGPSRGKAERRQGRRPLASLLFALGLGGASVFGWPPSGAGATEAQRAIYITQGQKLSIRFYCDYAVFLVRRRVALWLSSCTLTPVAA